MPIIIVILGLLAVLFAMPMHAQTQPWSLEQCCDYAVEHNITIKQQENQCRQQEIQLSNAKNQRLPDLSGSAGQNFSFGRGLTAQNTYTNTNTSSTSFSLGTSVPLFTGFQIPNNIKLNQLNLEAATQDLEKAKNDIRTQVAFVRSVSTAHRWLVCRRSSISAGPVRQNLLSRRQRWRRVS